MIIDGRGVHKLTVTLPTGQKTYTLDELVLRLTGVIMYVEINEDDKRER